MKYFHYKSWVSGLGCFYCNADSDELLYLFIGVIGSLFFASVFIAVGSFLRGAFRNSEETKFEVFEAEKRGSEEG